MGARPRPIQPISAESLAQIEQLAGVGLTINQIAAIINLAPRSVRSRRKWDHAFAAALARGRAKAAENVAKSLYQKCMEGDVQAIRWYEQSRLRHSGTAPVPVPIYHDEDEETDERYL